MFTVALAEDGVWLLGFGGSGRLGLGDTNDRLVPTRLGPGPGGRVWRVAGAQYLSIPFHTFHRSEASIGTFAGPSEPSLSQTKYGSQSMGQSMVHLYAASGRGREGPGRGEPCKPWREGRIYAKGERAKEDHFLYSLLIYSLIT